MTETTYEYKDDVKEELCSSSIEHIGSKGNVFLKNHGNYIMKWTNNILNALWLQLEHHPDESNKTKLRKNRKSNLVQVFERFAVLRAVTYATLNNKRVYFGLSDPRCTCNLLPASSCGDNIPIRTYWVDGIPSTVGGLRYYLYMTECAISVPLFGNTRDITNIYLNESTFKTKMMARRIIRKNDKLRPYPDNWCMIRKESIDGCNAVVSWLNSVKKYCIINQC